MKCQVIFLNTLYRPSEDELEELDKMQEFLSLCHNELHYQHRTLSTSELLKRKEEVHQRARKRLHVQPIVEVKN